MGKEFKSKNEAIGRLKSGDLRSIGKADEVVNDILKEATIFGEVFKGLTDNDPVIRMRCADVVEKVSRLHPEYLKVYKKKLIKEIPSVQQREVRWHMAQIFPRLELSDSERKEVIRILLSWLENDKSKIVKVNSMQALADFAEKDDKIRPNVLGIIKDVLKSGSPALVSRGRKLTAKLGRA